MIIPLTSPPLRLRLLGGFQLLVSGRELASIPRKAQALLVYLAMQEGRPVSRETVADLLWSDRGAEQARHSLRQMLLVLRRDLRAVGLEAIDAGEHAISFQPGAVEADVARMHRLAAATDRASLAEAADLYTGPFLADFPSVCPDFDAWMGQTRDRIASSGLDILGRLADLCGAEGDATGVVFAVERMVALDPMREDIHRRLMAAYAAAGRRTDALRQYNACVVMLRRDLDASPEAATVELALRIRQGERPDIPRERETVPARPAEGPPWIAVLPFRSRPGDDRDTWLSEGIIEGIIHTLSGIELLSVISRGTSMNYGALDVDPRTVGRELGVRYVLTGTVRRSANVLRINTELSDAEMGRILRSDRYEGTDVDLFDVQDQIANGVVNAIAPTVRDSELKRASRKHPESIGAYDLLLRGIDLLYSLRQDKFTAARDCFEQAKQHDPDFVSVYSHTATWHMLRIGQGWSPDVGADALEAQQNAAMAIERDPGDAVALAIYGQMLSFTQREYSGAREFLDRAIAMGPSCHMAWTLSSTTANWTGDGVRAVEHAARAVRLSPLDPFGYFAEHMLSQGYYISGDYDQAVLWGHRSATHNGMLTSNLRTLMAALVAIGDISGGRQVAMRMLGIEPQFRLARFAERSPIKREVLDLYLERLRHAGLPE